MAQPIKVKMEFGTLNLKGIYQYDEALLSEIKPRDFTFLAGGETAIGPCLCMKFFADIRTYTNGRDRRPAEGPIRLPPAAAGGSQKVSD